MSDNEPQTETTDELSANEQADKSAEPSKGGLLRIAIASLIILIPLLSISKNSILEWGTSSGSVPATKLALILGADVNQRFENDTMTPLMVAAYEGNANLVPMLIEAGANSTIQMKFGQTALYLAVKQNNADVIKTLINTGVDIKQIALTGGSNLYYAIKSDWGTSVKALLDAGDDPNKLTRQGYSLLTIAKSDGLDDIAQMLLDAGATTDDLDAQIKEYLAERDENTKKKADLVNQEQTQPDAEFMNNLLNMKQTSPSN